jgi:hypothetical protein
MKKIFLFLMLVMLSGCACKKPITNVNVETSHLEKINEIDNYQYKGITTIVYDSLVIVIEKESGDTVRQDHSRNKVTTTDNVLKSDTVYIQKSDSIQYITQTVTENRLNEFQKAMMAVGITSLIFIICFITYKVLRFFKK